MNTNVLIPAEKREIAGRCDCASSDINLNKATLTVAQTVQRAGGRLHLQDAKTDASESVLPLPELPRRALLAHRERQDQERERLAEVWTEHDLVFPGGSSSATRRRARRAPRRAVRAGSSSLTTVGSSTP